jgi:hypothetical protein
MCPTNNFYRSDLPGLNYIMQNSMIVFPKEIVVATLREFFNKDSFYHFVYDEYGFPKTPDQTDLPQDAGYHDDRSTRLFIGESYRYDVVFYPAIIVRHGGARFVPLSFNNERSSIQWDWDVYKDNFGNIKTFKVPQSFIYAGGYEGTITIDIMTRSLRSRDDLIELVTILFEDVERGNLQNAGFFVKGVSAGAGTETEDRNDKLFKQTVSITYRSEWRRNIPIRNVLEVLNFVIDFRDLSNPNSQVAPGLEINYQQTLVEILSNL